MATLQTRCLFSIFLLSLLHCVALRDAPARPEPPFCHRPCDMTRCSSDIHCLWSPSPEHQIRTNYSLHWKRPTGSEQKSSNNIIRRQHFHNEEELRVWVEAKNRDGSAKSPEVVLNPTGIYQPSPPIIEQDQDEAFVVRWESVCKGLDLIIGTCSVQYRTEDQDWREEEGYYSTYTIEEPQLCTAYDFRVRCACSSSLTSDWSAILTMQGREKTPEGELDVWRDCDPSHVHTGCILIWKRLPVSQACGFILGYDITIDNARSKVSVTEPGDEVNCSERRCHFAVECSATVSVSAYNAHGATKPSVLKWLRSGNDDNIPALHIDMNAEKLTVSWRYSSKLPDNLKAYVVQYRQFGSRPGQSFDWLKLNGGQTTALFRGQFKNYTAYQVSLFTLSVSGEVRHISSALGYSLQRVPSRVPSFAVSSLGNRQVNLQWEPVPIPQQYGVMQYYEIGLAELKATYKVYNLSARTHKLVDLGPGQVYNVWIRAVNAAGPGENATTRFTAKEREDYDMPVTSITSSIFIIFIICVLGFLAKRCSLCGSKVPDPKNSQIFREGKHQTSDSMAWICIVLSEPNPSMSLLEIVTSKAPQDVTSDTEERSSDRNMLLDSRDAVREDSVNEDSVTEERGQKDNRREPEAYRKMVDSDEEDVNSSDEEQNMTGYERHFMPTVMDMLEVSS